MHSCSVQVIPDWERLTAHIEEHKETKDALGWVSSFFYLMEIQNSRIFTQHEAQHNMYYLCACKQTLMERNSWPGLGVGYSTFIRHYATVHAYLGSANN